MRYLPIVLLLAGCGGESASTLADAHREAASKKLTQIAALAPIVERQPPLTEDVWNLPDGLKLDFVPHAQTFLDNGMPAPNPNYNAALAFQEHIANPSDGESLEWQSGSKDLFLLLVDKSDQWLLEPACLLATGKGRYGSEPVIDNMKRGFDWLERTKYLLVLRLPTRQPPGLILQELQAGEMKSFTSGHVAGDAVLYDLESGALLGGFVIDATSRSEEEVRNADVHGQLRRKLSDAVNEMIQDKLSKVGVPPR